MVQTRTGKTFDVTKQVQHKPAFKNQTQKQKLADKVQVLEAAATANPQIAQLMNAQSVVTSPNRKKTDGKNNEDDGKNAASSSRSNPVTGAAASNSVTGAALIYLT